MPFVCSCGNEDFYTHGDEEVVQYIDGEGDVIDVGEIMDSCQTHNWPYRCSHCDKEYSQIPPKDPEAEWVASRERLYLTKNAGICPICESEDISGGSIDMDGNSAWQNIMCMNCEAEWTDIYRLRNVEIESYSPSFLPAFPSEATTPTEVPNPNEAFKK